MNVLKMVAIHDSVAQVWMQPQFVQTLDEAVRSLQDAMADGSHTFAKHPEDFVLYCVGEYCQETGDVRGIGPEKVVNCAALVKVLPVNSEVKS